MIDVFNKPKALFTPIIILLLGGTKSNLRFREYMEFKDVREAMEIMDVREAREIRSVSAC